VLLTRSRIYRRRKCCFKWKNRRKEHFLFCVPRCRVVADSSLVTSNNCLVIYFKEGASIREIYDCVIIIKKYTPSIVEVSACCETITWSVKTDPNCRRTKIWFCTRRMLSLKALTNVRFSAGNYRYFFYFLVQIFVYKSLLTSCVKYDRKFFLPSFNCNSGTLLYFHLGYVKGVSSFTLSPEINFIII